MLVAVGVAVMVGVGVAVGVAVGVSVGVNVLVAVGVVVGVTVGVQSLNVQLTVSPLCRTMLVGVCVHPWLLVHVALVSVQFVGTLSVTE